MMNPSPIDDDEEEDEQLDKFDLETGNGNATPAANGAANATHSIHVPGPLSANDDAPPERCLELQEIADLHPESKINIKNVEDSHGLSTQEADRRRLKYGPNVLTPPPKTPDWRLLLQQFQHTFLLLLIGSALLSILAYFLANDQTNLILGIVLLVVVFLTGFGSFHEEHQASKISDSFDKMLASSCTVLRDGHAGPCKVDQLVAGDLVLVKNGDKVPADMVLLLCRGLKTECSSLTGEPEPIRCTDKPSPVDTTPIDCKNMVFNSGLCFDGDAYGLVVRTGDQTAIGTIAKLASNTDIRESPLQTEVRRFVQVIAVVAVAMAVVCFAASVFLQGASNADQILKLFVNGFLIIIVANVPQGLPSTVVSLLSLAARNMAKKAVLVKRLDCVETLGSTSIICSDKTGTLTRNVMTVTDVWYNESIIKHRGLRKWQARSLYGQEPQALLYRCAVLCNRGEPVPEYDKTQGNLTLRENLSGRIRTVSRLSWKGSLLSVMSKKDLRDSVPAYKGNPSDVALLNFCLDLRDSVESVRSDYPILFEVPFNSTNKWQLVVVQSKMEGEQPAASSTDTVQYEVLMKGAPEVILKRCTTFASTMKGQNQRAEVTEAFRKEYLIKNEQFADQGRRVLALCSHTFHGPKDQEFLYNEETGMYNFPTTNLNFIGLFAIMDPPRDNVPDAIARCHGAGVKVFMVTGDHPSTARAIAKQIGLLQSDNNIELLENKTSTTDWDSCEGAVIHGSRVEGLSDDQWRKVLSKTGVCFARTTPAHKLLIVQKCQTLMGAIVAVTGDGVNDAPALKQADVGVAMGLNGSAVAQDAADILLMDDNFASIVDAIAEGRLIFDNIKKTVAYTMAHILPEVFSAVISLLGGIPAGLTALQVLTIDVFTEMGPAISMAYEHAESDLMLRKPRDPVKDRLVSPVLLLYAYVTSGSIITVACMAAYVFTYRRHDVRLSDFGDSNSGEDFFTLTSEDPFYIERRQTTISAKDQRRIFSEAVTAFYITLAVAQFCHIWVCKTRIISIFTHGMFKNRLTIYGVGIGLVLVVFFSYVPGVQGIIGSGTVGWIPWVCALGAGAVLLLYNEGSKWVFRKLGRESRLVRALAW
jgi:sodium/potassium-transporting ATPase subunit alpha